MKIGLQAGYVASVTLWSKKSAKEVMMQLSEDDEKELQRLADEIDSIIQKLRAFRQRIGNLVGIQITPEYIKLLSRLHELEKEFDSIP